MTELILLRHGLTRSNLEWKYCGATDEGLCKEGIKKLEEMRAKCTYPEITGAKVYTSGMRRTEETLRLLYGELAHGVLPGFREMDFGRFESHTYAELKGDKDFQAFLDPANESVPCPFGESPAGFRDRVLHALSDLMKKEKGRVLLLTHGGPIALIMEQLFPLEKKKRYEWQPENGGGYQICFQEGHGESYGKIPKI